MAGDAKISLANSRIGGETIGPAFADDPPGLEQIAAVGDAEALPRVLLDEEDADPRLADMDERVEQLVGEERREPQRGLVEEQHLGGRHKSAADRHHLLLAAAHGAHRLAHPLRELGKQGQHDVAVLPLLRPGAARVGAEHQVLRHGQL